MNKFIDKLGQNPQRSLTMFLRGLGLFFIGLAFVAIGYFHQFWWQIIGIIILSFACLLSAWGYLGIFINRWLNIRYRLKKPSKHSN